MFLILKSPLSSDQNYKIHDLAKIASSDVGIFFGHAFFCLLPQQADKRSTTISHPSIVVIIS
jgi:hypothetical protein